MSLEKKFENPEIKAIIQLFKKSWDNKQIKHRLKDYMFSQFVNTKYPQGEKFVSEEQYNFVMNRLSGLDQEAKEIYNKLDKFVNEKRFDKNYLLHILEDIKEYNSERMNVLLLNRKAFIDLLKKGYTFD